MNKLKQIKKCSYQFQSNIYSKATVSKWYSTVKLNMHITRQFKTVVVGNFMMNLNHPCLLVPNLL